MAGNVEQMIQDDRRSCARWTSLAAVDAADKPSRTTVDRARHWFASCFYACGKDGLPTHVDYGGRRYALVKVLKHDFLAGTALYEADEGTGGPAKIVGKVSRRKHFCLIPLSWLGRLMTRREVGNLRRCEGIRGVPQVLQRTDANSYLYEYIEGSSLDSKPALPEDFFERLLSVLQQVHARGLAHLDLHKRGNILLGDDGGAYIIDFQLATYIGQRVLLSRRLSMRLRRRLQAYDIYHLYKHKRRLLPGELTEAEARLSRDNSLLLRAHRAIAGPLKRVRRACLRYLHRRGIITGTQGAAAHPETDPARWMKR